ncbi:MAG: putative lipid II flippase FtsW [Chloroflexi bacterium]|nr:putative lipid II flippase FtsW [Chloroflexota bacterium]
MLAELRRIDLGLLLAILVLVAIGVEMVFSASFVVAHNQFGDGTYFLTRHLFWIAIGLVALAVGASIDYRILPRFAVVIYLGSLALLALVLIPGLGQVTYGSARWLNLGPLSFQPSEVTKVALVIYLASWLAKVGDTVNDLRGGIIPFSLILLLTAGLVLLEPNLGTATVLTATAASTFFVAGVSLVHTLSAALVGAGGIAVLMGLAHSAAGGGYWSQRVEAFMDPWLYAEGIGWQTTQTLLALGSGGLTGLGLGAGRQKYYYVPNAHTDSIFAIVGEEIGFVGTSLVLALFLFIAWRGLAIAFSAPDPLGRLLAAGITSMIVWQALLNMAVISNTIPFTGEPLPFISYGGSAMVVNLSAAGILLSVSRRAQRLPDG